MNILEQNRNYWKLWIERSSRYKNENLSKEYIEKVVNKIIEEAQICVSNGYFTEEQIQNNSNRPALIELITSYPMRKCYKEGSIAPSTAIEMSDDIVFLIASYRELKSNDLNKIDNFEDMAPSLAYLVSAPIDDSRKSIDRFIENYYEKLFESYY